MCLYEVILYYVLLNFNTKFSLIFIYPWFFSAVFKIYINLFKWNFSKRLQSYIWRQTDRKCQRILPNAGHVNKKIEKQLDKIFPQTIKYACSFISFKNNIRNYTKSTCLYEH